MWRERGRKSKPDARYGLGGDALLFLSVAVQLLYNIFGQWPAQPPRTALINVFWKVGKDLNISDIYG